MCSFKNTMLKKIVTKGYKAVIVTTVEILPLVAATK